MDIYPLTIVKDRFNGTYSKGKYVAWNCQPCNVPEDSYTRDAFYLWENIYFFKDIDFPSFGIGDTIEEAIKNLSNKIKEDNND